jgi:hypothetical protein
VRFHLNAPRKETKKKKKKDALENHSPNSFRLAKLVPDIKNCNKAHNSVKLFCKGVPVRSSRRKERNMSRMFHR